MVFPFCELERKSRALPVMSKTEYFNSVLSCWLIKIRRSITKAVRDKNQPNVGLYNTIFIMVLGVVKRPLFDK
ncbi:hypothetical protein A142_12130 [Vibrio splendidus 12E03]|uniref:Uncharacterized protein n=1 Tax=Vibrio splendidus 12E03 TaxID=1191305 RepID=A0A1E5FBA8_VIBSP|nr:hypothetical protein A142_12130 [Vibrio splendidus 12E03]